MYLESLNFALQFAKSFYAIFNIYIIKDFAKLSVKENRFWIEKNFHYFLIVDVIKLEYIYMS